MAGHPWTSILWGVFWVGLASVARHYEQESISDFPLLFIFGLLAPLLTFTLFYLLGLPKKVRKSVSEPQVLAVYLFTAPIALLYALPVERFLDPLRAAYANAILLGIVSLWRSTILVQTYRTLCGLPTLLALVRFLMVGSLIFTIVGFFQNFNLAMVSGMGGLTGPVIDFEMQLAGNVFMVSLVTLILSLFTYFLFCADPVPPREFGVARKEVQLEDPPLSPRLRLWGRLELWLGQRIGNPKTGPLRRRSPFGTAEVLLLVVCLTIGVALTYEGQRAQNRAHQVVQAIQNNDVDRAIELLTQYAARGFPNRIVLSERLDFENVETRSAFPTLFRRLALGPLGSIEPWVRIDVVRALVGELRQERRHWSDLPNLPPKEWQTYLDLCLDLLRRELEDYEPYRTLDEVEEPLSVRVALIAYWLSYHQQGIWIDQTTGEEVPVDEKIIPDEKRSEATALLKRFAADHPSEKVRAECSRFIE